jgi:hypothetical protein
VNHPLAIKYCFIRLLWQQAVDIKLGAWQISRVEAIRDFTPPTLKLGLRTTNTSDQVNSFL